MKNFFKLFGIIALVAVIAFSMVACDNGTTEEPPPPPPPPATGTLTLFNISTIPLDVIARVDIFFGTTTTGTPQVAHSVPISIGNNHSWTLAPGAYTVRVTLNDGVSMSGLFNVTVGQTTNAQFNGNALN